MSEEPRARPVRLYDIGGSQLTREAVIHKYLHLVKFVAGRISVHLPSSVDINDLINDGVFGLLDAIEKYDGSRSVKFETYALTRINGSIIDALRSLDWVPRTIRLRARELERAAEELEARLGRAPTSEELAERLEMTAAALDALVARVRATALLSLEEVLPHRSGDGVPLAETLADDDSDVAFDLERDEQRSELAAAVESLPPQERTVITLYYFKGQRLRQIKAELGVSESRVSQIHSAAVAHLRRILR
ncbi:MAG TPA: FliA/WhiG family RNA polymerase sigma factor [Candidatus Cybelea sp.]